MQTDQIPDILWRVFRVKHRLMAVPPDQLARWKKRLGDSPAESGVSVGVDDDVLFRVGTILSRQKEPVTMGALSGMTRIPSSTTTRVVDWLVEHGHAQRLEATADRPIVRVALTQRGHGLYLSIDESVKQRITRILRPFPEQERESLVLLLRKLAQVLEEMEE